MIEPQVKTAIVISFVFGLLLDLVIWCNFKLAFLLVYYELVYSILIQGFVPYDYG